MDVLHKVQMDYLTKPQIIVHAEKSVQYSVFDGLWIPCSAKFVILGSKPKGHGILQVYQLGGGNCTLVNEIVREHSFKCGTFGASPIKSRFLATGNFAGQLEIWDVEDLIKPISSYDAHKKIINCIDGFGGQSVCCGAPEIVTGSRDGSVKLWDTRQHGKPVAVIEPAEGEDHRDCWSVAIGNSYNNTERVVCAGYDNGDIKMFDLRKLNVRWETNVKNGVCGLEFDRKDIEMNKLVATTLESKFYMFDTRTQHPKKGFGCSMEKAHSSTIWFARHLPQNREVFMTGGGNGSLCLWKYNYPEKRVKEDSDGIKYSVAGKAELLQNITVSNQPMASYQWCPDKAGLALATSFDQAFRVFVTTNLNLI